MQTVTQIVDALDHAASERDPVSVERIVDQFDRRSLGAFIMIPALLEITPVGGIPGVPTLIGLTIAVFAVQILIGREDLWLPGLIARRKVDADRLHQGASQLRPIARWMDRHFGSHLPVMIRPPMPRLAAAAILLLCLTVPPLELIPFASTLPMLTIAAFGLALLLRDGRVMLLAWIVMGASLWGVAELAFGEPEFGGLIG